nr:hypothetical protein BaRGS_032602 [Batillaria attramentaria]
MLRQSTGPKCKFILCNLSVQLSHKHDEYKLKVVFRNGTQYRMYNLRFKGSKTIKERKLLALYLHHDDSHVTLVELMTRLLHAVDVFTEQKNLDIAEEAEAAREVEEQQRQERERQLALELAEERKRREEEAVKEAIKESIAKSVPDEPAEDAEGAIAKLRFRIPGGQLIERRFWADNTLQDLLNFLTGKGFHTEDYKVLTTYPRRDV